jgi:hypothetical protein
MMKRPRRTLAEDTSWEAEELLLDHYRGLAAHEKVAIVLQLNRCSEDAALVGLAERHPADTEHVRRLRLASLKYGRDLMLKAYGWDPEVEGW